MEDLQMMAYQKWCSWNKTKSNSTHNASCAAGYRELAISIVFQIISENCASQIHQAEDVQFKDSLVNRDINVLEHGTLTFSCIVYQNVQLFCDDTMLDKDAISQTIEHTFLK